MCCVSCFRDDGGCRLRASRAAARRAFPAAAVVLVLACSLSPIISVILSVFGFVVVTAAAAWPFFFTVPAPAPAAASAEAAAAAAVAAATAAAATAAPAAAATSAAVAADASAHDDLEAADHSSLVPAPAARQLGAARLVFLDNLKAALTVIVVLHHVFGAFAGGGSLGLSTGNFRNALQPVLIYLQIMDQAWFMCAFFFLSALMAPASLARKGARSYMADRLRRLGVPFALFTWLVGPTLAAFVDGAVAGRVAGYAPSVGPPWFLFWLLIFSSCLVLVSDGGRAEPEFLVCPRPTLAWLLAYGLALGLLQFVEMVVLPGLIIMPITFGSFPFDCAFFFAGVVAARNRWLEAPFDAAEMRTVYGVVVGFAGVLAAALAIMFAGGAPGLLSENACDEAPSRGTPGLGLVGLLLVLCVCGGAFAVATLIAAVELFRSHADRETPASRSLAANAYAAYLVHPVVVMPLTGAFVACVRVATGRASAFTAASGVDFADCVTAGGSGGGGGAAVLAAGVLGVGVLSVPLTFAVAALARRLPWLGALL